MKIWTVSVALLACALVGCSRGREEKRGIRGPADLVGGTCAVVVGSMMGDVTKAVQEGINYEWFNDYNSSIEAVRLGRVDAMPLDWFFANQWVLRNPDDFAITEPYTTFPWAFFFAKGNPLRERVNEVLARMEKSGELGRLRAKWMEATDVSRLPLENWNHRRDFTGRKGVFRFATPGDREPICFTREDGIVGFDIDLARRIAYDLDMTFETVRITMNSLIVSVQTGKADMGGGGIAITKERAEKVDFSAGYYQVPTVLLIRRSRAVDTAEKVIGALSVKRAEGDGGAAAFVKSLIASFRRTFVVENRWQMMAQGLGITLFITLLASLLGTALAFPVWLARTSRLAWISALAKGYIAILQGTPVLVLLMVLFYIVFGSVDIDGLWVAVIGFGLNLSAYAGEMLRSGIGSIPKGQTEAALALGYAPHRAFVRVVLPQAVRAVLPVYRGELIGLLKMTSIVGYIAIGDLTKASDLVRSRTYESFFPLITTALIYFVASWLLALLLERAGRRLDPAARRAANDGKED